MRTKHVIVEEYDPLWIQDFLKIKSELMEVLQGKIVSIEHVGSTSVEGLCAKPIIDIDIVIDNNFTKVKEALESLDYIHEGDLGIVGREAFRYINKSHLKTHHLYVCNVDSEELHRHITFRDYLRCHNKEKEMYGQIKREMARKFPEDIDSYLEGKQPVILGIYKKCGLLK